MLAFSIHAVAFLDFCGHGWDVATNHNIFHSPCTCYTLSVGLLAVPSLLKVQNAVMTYSSQISLSFGPGITIAPSYGFFWLKPVAYRKKKKKKKKKKKPLLHKTLSSFLS